MKNGDAGVKNDILTPGGERKRRIHRIGEVRKKNLDNICEGKIIAILKGYGYIKNHKKTVKNGQTRTRETEEHKRSQRFKAKAKKSQPLVNSQSTKVNQ
ncbi:hypothetical protein Tco_0271291 [Tanacetum coccineum]